jgi:hypothetical protein
VWKEAGDTKRQLRALKSVGILQTDFSFQLKRLRSIHRLKEAILDSEKQLKTLRNN